MEKKITVPPWAVDRIAPPSQPGTSTHTTVMSAGPPASPTAADERHRVAGVGEDDASASPLSASRSTSRWTGTTAIVRAAPASAAAASDSDPLLPAPPTTHDRSAGCPRSTYWRDDPGGERRGSAHVHDRQRKGARQVVRASPPRSSARRGSRSRVHGTCSLVPSQRCQPVGDDQRRQRQRDQGRDLVPDCEPERRRRARPPPTVPVSMPPEPVTGLCILPRLATMSSTSARTAAPSPPCFSRSWRNDAASRFSRATSIRTSSGHSSAPGVQPQRGLGQDAGRLEHAVQTGRVSSGLCETARTHETSCGRPDTPKTSRHVFAAHRTFSRTLA